MISVKDNSVKLHDFSPQILLAIMIANDVYTYEGAECVITSLNDGKHSPTSLHNIGHAVDLRIWDLDDAEATANDIRDRLKGEYDVILEEDHIHIEYQPKKY